MAGVGTAYVSVRVDTSKFEGDLEKMLSRLSTKMNKAGDQLGKDMVKGLKGTDWDSGFKGLSDSANKAATGAVRSLDRIDTKADSTARTVVNATRRMTDSMDEYGDSARHASSATGDLRSSLNGASGAARRLNLNNIGGGGRGGALRKAGDDAGFFRTQLNKLASEAEKSIKTLNHLFNLEAGIGTAAGGLVGALSAVAQGIFAIGANAASAIPALAALTNGIIGLGQIGATVGLSMQGVGAAIKAGFTAQKDTAAAAAKATKGLGDQAKKLVKPAEVSRDAIIAAKKAVQDAARGIADAKETLRRAYQSAGQAASDAARRVRRAEADLADSQGKTLAAQQALNDARATALEQLEDIGFAAEDAALGEQRAELALQDAYAKLLAVSELAPDNRQRQDAELAFKEAELNLREAKDAREDADKAQADAAATGIEGTQAMQDAHENLTSAQVDQAQAAQDLADAQREQGRTTIDNAQSIQDAEQNLADAREAHREALQGVIAAQEDYRKALKEAAQAAAEANKAIKLQNAKLAEAPASVDLFAQAMKNLSPSQQEFVRRIMAMHDSYIEFRKAIAEPLFSRLLIAMDGVNAAGKDGKTIMDVLTDGLKGTSAALGDTAIKASGLAANDVFQKSLGDVMKTNNKALEHFGGAAVDLAAAFVQVADAAQPLFRNFSEWVQVIAAGARHSATLGNRSGELTDKFKVAEERVRELAHFFGALWDVLIDVGGAASDAANQFDWANKKGDDKQGFIPMLTRNLKDFHKEFDKKSSIEGFDQSLQTLAAAGRAIKNSLIDPLTSLGRDKGIEKAFKILGNKQTSDAIQSISDNAGPAVPKLARIVSNVLKIAAAMSDSGAIEHFLDILKQVSKWAGDFVTWLSKIKLGPLNTAITKVSDAIAKFLDFIGLDTLSDWFDKVDAGGKSLLQLAGYITGAIAAYKILKKLFVLTTSPFAKLATGALDFGKAILKGDIKGAFKGLFSKNKGSAAKSGEDITEAFADGIRAGMTHKDAAMKALGKNVEKELKKIVTKYRDDAIKVGTDLMEGLELGLREGGAEAVIKATEAGRKVANAVGKGAGTHSPSTITFKSGADVMEGLELGMKEGLVEAELTATKAGSTVGHTVGNSAKTAAATSSAGIGPAMSTSATASMGKSSGKMAGALGKMMTPLRGVARGFGGLMTLAMGPFGIALDLIILLLPIIIPLLKKLEEKTGIFSKTLGLVTDGLSWLWDKIKEVFGWVQDNWPLLLAIITGPIGLAVLAITKHWDDIKGVVEGAYNFIKDLLPKIWNGIVSGLNTAWDKVQEIWGTIITWIRGRPEQFTNNLRALWNILKDGLSTAWGKVQEFWSTIITWIKGRPDQFVTNLKLLWDILKDGLSTVWDKVTAFWGTIITWIQGRPEQFVTNLSKLWDVLRDGIETAWNAVKKFWTDTAVPWLEGLGGTVANKLKNLFLGVASGFVSAVNWVGGKMQQYLWDPLNSILKKFGVDSIEFHWSDFSAPQSFAEGGPVKGKGGPKQDRVLIRASPGEYVLPASSARALGPKALEHMRKNGTLPMGDVGDFFGSVWHKAKDIGSAIGNGAEFALKWVLSKAVDKLPGGLIGDIVKGVIRHAADAIASWGAGKDAEAAAAQVGSSVFVSDPSNPMGIGSWKGGLFTRRFVKHMQAAEKLSGVSIVVIQGGFRPETSYSGTTHRGDALDTIVSNALIIALRRVGIAAGDRTGLGNWAPHVHAIPGPSAGLALGQAIWQWQDYIARGGAKQSLKSPWGLASGGTVRATPGGVMAMIAEGGRAERVTPLDREGFSAAERRMIELLEQRLGGGGSGGDTYNIHPSQRVDEAALADMVSRRVAWNRRRGARAG